ncbi:MAG: MarR family transcriptional regulator [Opitutales bacterium]|nr:MarR family transcriptional regulator [Opitutales bacterium]
MKDAAGIYQELYEEIRKMHNRLRWLGDHIHRADGQTSAKRSLLWSLHEEGSATVPQLAAERLVSRQIIQTQVNLLLTEGLVKFVPNPRHKRSKLLTLTSQGKALIEKMRQRETALLEQTGSPLTADEVEKTVTNLRALRTHLENNTPFPE